MRGWILVGAGALLLCLIVSQLKPSSAAQSRRSSDGARGGSILLPEEGQFLQRPATLSAEAQPYAEREDALSLAGRSTQAGSGERRVRSDVPAGRASQLLGEVVTPEERARLQEEARIRALEADSETSGRSDSQTGAASNPRRPAPEWRTEHAIVLASTLLHEPSAVPSWLSANGAGLSETRRQLSLALAAAVQGDRGRASHHADGLEEAKDVLSGELDLLRAALDPQGGVAAYAGANGADANSWVRKDSFLTQAASMALLASEASAELDAGSFQEAAMRYSELLLNEVESPWEAEIATLRGWTDQLHRAQAGHRWNRLGDWPAVEVTVQPGDSLVAIRKRVIKSQPGMLICTGLIERANEIGGRHIQPDDVLRIPTEPVSMRVDLSARWIFYMHGSEVVGAWQVGIGAPGNDTRPGRYTVGEKIEKPTWFRPGMPPVPYGDPENALGARWISWLQPDGRESSLGFHGTIEPQSMGQAVSQGCIRMRNEQVVDLFEILPKGSPIDVRP